MKTISTPRTDTESNDEFVSKNFARRLEVENFIQKDLIEELQAKLIKSQQRLSILNELLDNSNKLVDEYRKQLFPVSRKRLFPKKK